MSSTLQANQLALSSLDVTPGKMASWFHPDIREYQIYYENDAHTITLTAATQNPDATLHMADQTLGSQGSVQLPLAPGLNHYTLTISSPHQADRNIAFRFIRKHPAPNWKRIATDRAWSARDSAGELVFNNQMWLFGGYVPKVIHDLWRSDNGIDWEQMPDVPATGGINIPMRWVFQHHMWITSQAGELLKSSDGITWEIVTTQLPFAARRTAGTVVFNGKMWVIGGADKSGFKNDVWSSVDGKHWTLELEQAPWSPRQLWDNVVVHRDRIWIIGGGIQRYHPAKTYRDVWSSADGIHWQPMTPQAPWAGRIWNSCVTYQNRMWMMGGFQSEPKFVNLNDVWWSDDGEQWHELKTADVWSPRHEISPYVLNGKLWVVGGNGWPLLNDVWQLDIPRLIFLTEPVIEDYARAHYQYHARADFHPEGGQLSYELINSPDWLKVDPKTGLVHGQVPEALTTYDVTLKATSPDNQAAMQSWKLNIIKH